MVHERYISKKKWFFHSCTFTHLVKDHFQALYTHQFFYRKKTDVFQWFLKKKRWQKHIYFPQPLKMVHFVKNIWVFRVVHKWYIYFFFQKKKISDRTPICGLEFRPQPQPQPQPKPQIENRNIFFWENFEKKSNNLNNQKNIFCEKNNCDLDLDRNRNRNRKSGYGSDKWYMNGTLQKKNGFLKMVYWRIWWTRICEHRGWDNISQEGSNF